MMKKKFIEKEPMLHAFEYYKRISINNTMEKSPLEDIPCIKADITMQEIVELLRESRAGI